MHLIRLLISGTHVLAEGQVVVDVGEHRESLLCIKSGQMPLNETDQWRKQLQRQFEAAFKTTPLPDRPDYERVNEFLIRGCRLAMED